MSIKEQIRAEIDKLYGEYKDKFHQSGDQYHLGLIDGLDMAERVLDTLPEQPVEGIEDEIEKMWRKISKKYYYSPVGSGVCAEIKRGEFNDIARHFAEWGRKQVLQEIYDGKVKPVDKITVTWLDDESKAKEDEK